MPNRAAPPLPAGDAATRRTCTRTFPATPSQVREARRFLAGLLDGFPATDDALTCLSELASNAIQHTHSARPGGQFTVHASLSDARLRVEVQDDGGPWHPKPDQDGKRGHGLVIVAALTRWGVTGGEPGPRRVWFEISRL